MLLRSRVKAAAKAARRQKPAARASVRHGAYAIPAYCIDAPALIKRQGPVYTVAICISQKLQRKIEETLPYGREMYVPLRKWRSCLN
ncbi:hypothetical protein NPIL_94511, partial [Nephila pilipes]